MGPVLCLNPREAAIVRERLALIAGLDPEIAAIVKKCDATAGAHPAFRTPLKH